MLPQQDASIKPRLEPTGTGENKSKALAASADRQDTHLKLLSTAHEEQGLGKRIAPTTSQPRKKLKVTRGSRSQHSNYKNLSSSWLKTHHAIRPPQAASSTSLLSLIYHTGDMFADAPKGSLLIHACNTQGHWGAGIAKVFRTKYPNAYIDFNNFCTKEHSRKNPVPTGTAQLLAPQDGNTQHWIGCVFTSAKYGKAKDKIDEIIRNTVKSMQMQLELVSQVGDEITDIRMCKINNGKFGVPWEKTEEALQDFALRPQWRRMIEVWEPAE